MSWLDFGALEDIPRRGARVIRTAHGCVAVFRTGDDQVFAIDDRCPHKGGPLSEGIVHGHSVTCPSHNCVLSLETGLAQGADEGTVHTYPARVEGGGVSCWTRRGWSGGLLHEHALDLPICPYCGVGCGVIATPDGAGGAQVTGDAAHPANLGRLCSKGTALGQTLGLEERVLAPLIG